jgi:nicotinate-nucleotide--dimethylbenzimidazole phosphoribosyltransferase
LISSQRANIDGESLLANTDTANSGEVAITLTKPTMLVFAGDHGINEEGLSIAPSEVTRQMVLNFLNGGAAINCFCRSNQINLTVIDCGIVTAITPVELPEESMINSSPKLVEHRLGKGTANFSKQPAMSMSQVEQGFSFGEVVTSQIISDGVEIVLLGEMGIANTSSASALMAALSRYSVDECVGRGTGISDEQFVKKLALIKTSLTRVGSLIPLEKPLELSDQQIMILLCEVGGFEIVQMVSSIITAAAANVPVVIDGFIVTVAALVAIRLQPNVSEYLFYAHVSQEKAHHLLLDELMKSNDLQPLLSLGLRLGEGTGAALALPLIQAAASFYNDMASFAEAGVTV